MLRVDRWMAAVAVFAVAVAAAGYAYYRSESAQIHRQRYEAIAAIGTLKAEQLHLWRQVQLDHAESLSHAPTLADGLAAHLQTADPATNRARGVLASSVATYGYAAGYLLTPTGQVRLAVGRPVDAPDADDLPIVRAALAATTPVMGSFFRGADGRVYLDTAAAVRDAEGAAMGVVVLRTDAQKPLFSMLQSWPVPSPSAEVVLARRDGDDVVFLNDLRNRPGSALTIRKPITLTTLPAVNAVLGTQGPFEGVDYRGVAVLADLQPVAQLRLVPRRQGRCRRSVGRGPLPGRRRRGPGHAGDPDERGRRGLVPPPATGRTVPWPVRIHARQRPVAARGRGGGATGRFRLRHPGRLLEEHREPRPRARHRPRASADRGRMAAGGASRPTVRHGGLSQGHSGGSGKHFDRQYRIIRVVRSGRAVGAWPRAHRLRR